MWKCWQKSDCLNTGNARIEIKSIPAFRLQLLCVTGAIVTLWTIGLRRLCWNNLRIIGSGKIENYSGIIGQNLITGTCAHYAYTQHGSKEYIYCVSGNSNQLVDGRQWWWRLARKMPLICCTVTWWCSARSTSENIAVALSLQAPQR